MILNTTLEKIREHSPCRDGWSKLLKHLGKTAADNEPLAIATIIDANGLDDALWCLRAVSGHDREIRLFGVWCARQVQYLMKDPRSIASLDVAERFANGEAREKELDAACAAAEAAAWAASRAAGAAAWAAALAARAAAEDAAGAARAAARYAARAAAGAAASAARAAGAAAEGAQEKELRAVCARITEQSPGN
jgi:hypothetical protein